MFNLTSGSSSDSIFQHGLNALGEGSSWFKRLRVAAAGRTWVRMCI